MWRPRHHRNHQGPGHDPSTTMPQLEAAIVEEAHAIIEGRMVDQLWAQGRPIPAWAWLNALAHRPADKVGDLIGVACDQPADRWADALVDIAIDLGQIAAAQAASIQTDLFVPAELEALAGRDLPPDPGQLVRAVRRRRASDGRRPVPNPPNHPDQTPHSRPGLGGPGLYE